MAVLCHDKIDGVCLGESLLPQAQLSTEVFFADHSFVFFMKHYASKIIWVYKLKNQEKVFMSIFPESNKVKKLSRSSFDIHGRALLSAPFDEPTQEIDFF